MASLARPGRNIKGMSMMTAPLGGKRLELLSAGRPAGRQPAKMIADLGLKYRMPVLTDNKESVEAGGLLSLELDLVESYRRAATHVDKILKGASPAILPMEQPTKFDLFINLKTARTLGLTIPPSVLIQASHVIQ